MSDMPTHGGRWARDRKTGGLTPLPGDEDTPEAAAPEAPAVADAPTTSKGKT